VLKISVYLGTEPVDGQIPSSNTAREIGLGQPGYMNPLYTGILGLPLSRPVPLKCSSSDQLAI